ncbi:hypothetical protein OsI_30560 [Oryza sativa Indica Group]|uniref:Uncharacterized protein n=1 Tax=Oryza sativa subsp. indica TaxID=39946 RepID=B8BDE4_ORYSI|nr:hypothetical protein OsI_30560 [Oryza sativa Indica Group]
MEDTNKNLAQQGDANGNPAHRGLPPRHLIIPYSVAAAMANRPIRLASQARLLSGGGGAVAQQPPTQHAIAAQRRLPSRNPWSRIVRSLLLDGKSYHIIYTSFTSEEVFVPAPPPPLLVSTVGAAHCYHVCVASAPTRVDRVADHRLLSLWLRFWRRELILYCAAHACCSYYHAGACSYYHVGACSSSSCTAHAFSPFYSYAACACSSC